MSKNQVKSKPNKVSAESTGQEEKIKEYKEVTLVDICKDFGGSSTYKRFTEKCNITSIEGALSNLAGVRKALNNEKVKPFLQACHKAVKENRKETA